nr:hypothetical protein GCM10025732_29600 [Glycomyces mayteni]
MGAITSPSRQREIEFRVFGPTPILLEGQAVEVRSGGPRELLTMMLLNRYHVVPDWLFLRAMPPEDLRHDREPLVRYETELRTALAGTGVEVVRYRSFPGSSARFDATLRDLLAVGSVEDLRGPGFQLVGPVMVDLNLCGDLIVRAFEARHAETADQLLASAAAVVEGTP